MVNSKKIVFLNHRAGYLDARKLAADKGMKLASNVLHDDYLVRTNRWRTAWPYSPYDRMPHWAWAREVLVYPAPGLEFIKGKDVFDSNTQWCLPAEYLEKKYLKRDLFGRGMFSESNMGLIVDPEDLREEGGRIVVIPASISVLYPFIQKEASSGKVDEETGIPLDRECRTELEKRVLHRWKGNGVVPLARIYDPHGDFRLTILADNRADDPLRVAIEAIEPGTPEKPWYRRLGEKLGIGRP